MGVEFHKPIKNVNSKSLGVVLVSMVTMVGKEE